ncbi:MAG: hypothetical protein ACLUZZ_00150 [Alistipes inops]
MGKYFTVEELVCPPWRSRGIDNTPPPQAVAALCLIGHLPTRFGLWGGPVVVNSGYLRH